MADSAYTISQDELMERTGVRRRDALERELTRLRIPFFISKGGIWTTPAALDAALGLRQEGRPRRLIRIGDGEAT